MKARYLLTICVVLITVSVFVVPGTIYVGIDRSLATELSSIMLLAGIVSAVLTVNQDAKEGREIELEGRR
ncbi:hypothetical protein [Methanocella sp. MCL-LM]|uniref:hypothetical protein n=1 Tax=Methanocella sp. MCL-LM TaxID=3412035 RepID=UPI003C74F149